MGCILNFLEQRRVGYILSFSDQGRLGSILNFPAQGRPHLRHEKTRVNRRKIIEPRAAGQHEVGKKTDSQKMPWLYCRGKSKLLKLMLT